MLNKLCFSLVIVCFTLSFNISPWLGSGLTVLTQFSDTKLVLILCDGLGLARNNIYVEWWNYAIMYTATIILFLTSRRLLRDPGGEHRPRERKKQENSHSR